MSVAVRDCFVGARGIDSLVFSQTGNVEQAKALRAAGLDFVALYLGVAKAAQHAACMESGLMTFGVTLAGVFDGTAPVAHAKAIGLPLGVTLYIDVEGKRAYDTPSDQLVAYIDRWATVVRDAGYVAGIYLGSPQPLTSEELYALKVTRYWKGIGRTVDRNGKLAEPYCGWSMYQAYPSRMWAGVWVDVNMVTQDHKGRVPQMAQAAPLVT